MTKKAPAFIKEVAPPNEKLDELREMVSKVAILEHHKEELETDLSIANEQIQEMRFRTMPNFMDENGISKIVVDDVEATALPYYKANIAANWPEEKRAAAFDWLDANGHGDLIKTQIVVILPREDRELAGAVMCSLRELGVTYETSLTVPWKTLSAWLREQVEKGSTPPLEVIGGVVGREVKLKRRPAA